MLKDITDIINNNIVEYFSSLKNKSIIIAPQPYMGQNGPFKKPVFIIFLSQTVLTTLSKIHPKKEYTMKYVIRFKKLYSIYPPCFSLYTKK